jgi:response regulator of citrate/malate metabolism
MPDRDGFDVLRSIPVEAMPVVIFTTAHDKYAVSSFEMHALDYLLKPFDQDRSKGAIQPARLELSTSKNGEFTQRIVVLLRLIRVRSLQLKIVLSLCLQGALMTWTGSKTRPTMCGSTLVESLIWSETTLAELLEHLTRVALLEFTAQRL